MRTLKIIAIILAVVFVSTNISAATCYVFKDSQGVTHTVRSFNLRLHRGNPDCYATATRYDGAIKKRYSFWQMSEFTLERTDAGYKVIFKVPGNKNEMTAHMNFETKAPINHENHFIEIRDDEGISGEIELSDIKWPVKVKK